MYSVTNELFQEDFSSIWSAWFEAELSNAIIALYNDDESKLLETAIHFVVDSKELLIIDYKKVYTSRWISGQFDQGIIITTKKEKEKGRLCEMMFSVVYNLI